MHVRTVLSAFAALACLFFASSVGAQERSAPKKVPTFPEAVEAAKKAVEAGLKVDPRIKTSMIFDSGVYNVPGGMSRVKVSKFDLYSVHGPTAYVTGGPTDQAHPNAMDDAGRIKHVPVFLGWLPVGHGGTFSQPNGGDWASIAVKWLDWQLKADAGAGKWFVGDDCGYCKDARWRVEFNPKR